MTRRLVIEFALAPTTLNVFNSLVEECGGTVRWLPIEHWFQYRDLIVEQAGAVVIDKVDPRFRHLEELAEFEEWFLFHKGIEAHLLLLEPTRDCPLDQVERHDRRVLIHSFEERFSYEDAYRLVHSCPRHVAEAPIGQVSPFLVPA